MQILYHDLESQLQSNHTDCYLLYGAEPLLIEDSSQLIRKKVFDDAKSERIRFFADTQFEWNQLSAEFDSFSLFAQKKIIELRLPSGKPGTKGANILKKIFEDQHPETIFIIICQKIDGTVKRSSWFKAAQKQTLVVDHPELKSNQYIGWIKNRCEKHNLNLSHDAIRLLAYYLEGNILAIDQQIKKFALFNAGQQVTQQDISQAVEDTARFTIYAYIDAAIAGNSQRSLRILTSLRREGEELVLLNWALAREIRSLHQMAIALAKGEPVGRIFSQFRVWSTRKSIIESALRRISVSGWCNLHRQIALLDKQIKGYSAAHGTADIWTQYEILTMNLSKTGNV